MANNNRNTQTSRFVRNMNTRSNLSNEYRIVQYMMETSTQETTTQSVTQSATQSATQSENNTDNEQDTDNEQENENVDFYQLAQRYETETEERLKNKFYCNANEMDQKYIKKKIHNIFENKSLGFNNITKDKCIELQNNEDFKKIYWNNLNKLSNNLYTYQKVSIYCMMKLENDRNYFYFPKELNNYFEIDSYNKNEILRETEQLKIEIDKIKRSFNVNNFKYFKKNYPDYLKKVNLLSNYLKFKESDRISLITNIGLFSNRKRSNIKTTILGLIAVGNKKLLTYPNENISKNYFADIKILTKEEEKEQNTNKFNIIQIDSNKIHLNATIILVLNSEFSAWSGKIFNYTNFNHVKFRTKKDAYNFCDMKKYKWSDDLILDNFIDIVPTTKTNKLDFINVYFAKSTQKILNMIKTCEIVLLNYCCFEYFVDLFNKFSWNRLIVTFDKYLLNKNIENLFVKFTWFIEKNKYFDVAKKYTTVYVNNDFIDEQILKTNNISGYLIKINSKNILYSDVHNTINLETIKLLKYHIAKNNITKFLKYCGYNLHYQIEIIHEIINEYDELIKTSNSDRKKSLEESKLDLVNIVCGHKKLYCVICMDDDFGDDEIFVYFKCCKKFTCGNCFIESVKIKLIKEQSLTTLLKIINCPICRDIKNVNQMYFFKKDQFWLNEKIKSKKIGEKEIDLIRQIKLTSTYDSSKILIKIISLFLENEKNKTIIFHDSFSFSNELKNDLEKEFDKKYIILKEKTLIGNQKLFICNYDNLLSYDKVIKQIRNKITNVIIYSQNNSLKLNSFKNIYYKIYGNKKINFIILQRNIDLLNTNNYNFEKMINYYSLLPKILNYVGNSCEKISTSDLEEDEKDGDSMQDDSMKDDSMKDDSSNESLNEDDDMDDEEEESIEEDVEKV